VNMADKGDWNRKEEGEEEEEEDLDETVDSGFLSTSTICN